MTPSPRVWLGTFAALVFLIGGLTGVVVDRAWLMPRPGGGGPGMGRGLMIGAGGGRGAGPMAQSPDRVVADLDGELQLSADQKAEILKILEAWRPRVQALQNTARGEFVSAQAQLHADIARTLTPDQAKRFQDLSARLLEGGRGPRGGGPGPGRGRGRQ